ncbi:hypothetical protein HYW32_01655 [Candidatus Berkelbacteria bacterium]|nr:hypothetical protein [Candidatus Berkelbacteria bacterium]
MKRILWISRHGMNPVQLGALRRLFGADVRVERDSRPFDNAETIVRRVREGGYDDVITVVPLSVLARMVDLGLRPLWSEAEIVAHPEESDWEVNGRYYRFVRFRRVRRLVLEFDELGADARRQPDD